MTPEPAVELSLFQFEGFNDALMAVASDRMDTARDRRALRKLERGRFQQRLATRRSFDRYMAEGGDAGSVQGFLEWLIANWESIFKIIMQIVGLFGAAATVNGEAPAPAAGFFDFDAASESIARKLLELVSVAKRHGLAAEAAIEAYIAKAWPAGEPAPPVEVQRAFALAIAA